eukprot:TRINITY_DN70655_c0_g1_i1.p1 TRINITY_DN70655_c0_g1~~TRINITY_DN70655_c0_g1_i1.p1  ORF type:complete len:566 (+),score=69.39 TRINITY_DN70655_c0_g1_i1:172-1869(+)
MQPIEVTVLREPFFRGMHIFRFLILVLILFSGAASLQNEVPLKQIYPIEQPNQRNRRFSLFSDSPTAAFLEQNEGLQKKVDPMVAILKGLVHGIDKERQEKKRNQCNLQEDFPNWVYTARLNSRYFQIGKLSTKCYTRMDGDDCVLAGSLSAKQVANSIDTIGTGVEGLYYALSRVSDWSSRLGVKNWNQTHHLRGWKNQDLSEECRVETFSAYRFEGDLYIRAAMTNYDVDQYLKDCDRQFVMEWVKEDYSTSLRMVQPKHGGSKMENGSTILWTRNGRAWLSWHGEMKESTNPALQKVIAARAVEIDLARDAVVPANIALLALPLAMTLIPVAFLAELNSCGFLWYVMFTDVISTVPLLVKGVELIRTTRARSELVSYYAGDRELADIQVWAASCNGTQVYKHIGTSFVVISAIGILGGIALELFATRYMENKKKEEGSATVEGPFGKAVFEVTARGLLGTGHGAEWERYSETVDLQESDEERRSTAKRTDATWKASLCKIVWFVWQVLHFHHDDGEAAKRTSHSPTFTEPKCTSDGAESLFVAGVGQDGMASAERVENGPTT